MITSLRMTLVPGDYVMPDMWEHLWVNGDKEIILANIQNYNP